MDERMVIFWGNAWQTKVLMAGIDPSSNKLTKLTNHVSPWLVALEGLKKGINMTPQLTLWVSLTPSEMRRVCSLLLYLMDHGSCPQVPAWHPPSLLHFPSCSPPSSPTEPSSSQPNWWGRLWPRGLRLPSFMPQRRASRRLMPKPYVRSSNTPLMPR